jgi:hypothetical protein
LRGAELAVVTPDAHKAFGLCCALPGLRVLAARAEGDDAPPAALLEAYEAAGAELQTVPLEGERNTTRGILDAPAAVEWLTRWERPAVVVFRPEADTAQRLAELGCRLVGAAPQVARKLENKRFFRALCRQAGLPVVETHELVWPPGAANAAVWRPLEGRIAIVQTPRGYAGRRTWRWEVGGPLPDVPEHVAGRPVLLAPLLEGPTWTVNAVAGPAGVRCGPPMRQITGDPRLTALPLASCGVALAPPGAAAVAEELLGLARGVGRLATRAGFVGFFGIDAVGSPGELRLIEMNPRLTATLTVATLMELSRGARPLTVDHLAHCLGVALAPAEDVSVEGMSGGHLLVRDAPGWSPVVPELGTYRLGPSKELVRVGGGAGVPGEGEVTVWPSGPSWGTPVDDRGRLLFSSGMMGEGGELSDLVEGVLAAVVKPAGESGLRM